MWLQVLPLMRVKKLMKEEADVKAVAGDASYAAARATVCMPQHTLPLFFELWSRLCFSRDCRAELIIVDALHFPAVVPKNMLSRKPCNLMGFC